MEKQGKCVGEDKMMEQIGSKINLPLNEVFVRTCSLYC